MYHKAIEDSRNSFFSSPLFSKEENESRSVPSGLLYAV